MNLCTLPQAKRLLKIAQSESKYDDDLRWLIEAVSARIEGYLGRTVLVGDYTEYFDVDAGDRIFQLSAYPIVSITSVWNDCEWSFPSSTLVDSDNYKEDATPGLLYIDPSVLVSGWQALKVSYNGGMASDTGDFVNTYPDIAEACVRQVAYAYNTSKHVGALTVSAEAGSVNWIGEVAFIDSVRAVLNAHKTHEL